MATMDNPFEGKRFAVTGIMTRYYLVDIFQIIRGYGGFLAYDPSKADIVICGCWPGTSRKVAEERGLEIWNEEEFIRHIDGMK